MPPPWTGRLDAGLANESEGRRQGRRRWTRLRERDGGRTSAVDEAAGTTMGAAAVDAVAVDENERCRRRRRE